MLEQSWERKHDYVNVRVGTNEWLVIHKKYDPDCDWLTKSGKPDVKPDVKPNKKLGKPGRKKTGES